MSSGKTCIYHQILYWSAVGGISYGIFKLLAARRSERSKEELLRELQQAEERLKELEAKLLALENPGQSGNTSQSQASSGTGKEVRIWMDGVYDMMHYGHMNAFRQGRALGTYLVVGINSDDSVAACKGRPICNEQERIDTVKGCKFVDEVVTGVPYVMNDEYVDFILREYRIDFIVHGDDPCIVDGKNVYQSAINKGKYLTIPRTEGISTTDIVGRMLLMSSSHHDASPLPSSSSPASSSSSSSQTSPPLASQQSQSLSVASQSQFLTTSRILRLFSVGTRAPSATDRVVYVAGGWDMFHAGHVEFLEKARSLGTYLIVGVYGDATVNKMQGFNLPILSLHERTLSVLGCKYVDDALLDAPPVLSAELLASLHISVVAVQQKEKSNSSSAENDPLAVARAKGMVVELPRGQYRLSAMDFVERILNQRERFADRFQKKMAAEQDFYKHKYNL